MPPDDDASLMAAVARSQDRRAFERLYDRHQAMVNALAWRMMGAEGEAEDMMQQVFLYAWERAGLFDPTRGSVAAWLTVVTRSRCLDRLRYQQRRRRRELPLEQEIMEALPAGPDEAAPDPDARRAVAAALERLPQSQRQVIEAAYYEGRTQAEMAATWGLPLGTVKGRMRLAMDKLAQALAGERRS